MVDKKLCDGCGVVIAVRRKRYETWEPESGLLTRLPAQFSNRNREYDLCQHCGDYIERCLIELKAKYLALQKFTENPTHAKDQKELSDFE